MQRKVSYRRLPVLASVLAALAISCSSAEPPTFDLIIASAALNAAERAQAERRAPDLFNRAQSAFWKSKQLYLLKEFKQAKHAAYQARRLAEKAELDAELTAIQTGSLP